MAKTNFPDSPSDGDTFGDFIYNDTDSVWNWNVLPGTTAAGDLLEPGQVIANALLYTFEYIVVGGGGGSSPSPGYGSGAGGGGYRASVLGENSGRGRTPTLNVTLSDNTNGLVAEPVLTLSSGQSFSVSVGAGGAGYANGSNSSLAGVESLGGGRGGASQNNYFAGSGGCGGSATNAGAGTFNQGYDGIGNSTFGHGGGGAGGGPSGSAGGVGVSSSITGSAVERCAGGGGEYGGTWTNGAANSGNGAKSGSYTGGSGVVVVKYPSEVNLSIGAGLSSTTTTSGSYKITQFTAGSDTVTLS